MDELRRAVRGRWVRPPAADFVRGVATDTRNARPGELFFALRGQRLDGHAFLPEAASAGCAAAVVCDDAAALRQAAAAPGKAGEAGGMGLLATADSLRALSDLAAFYRRSIPARVVAVTGSNGKTTVARMIAHVLSRRLTGSCAPKSFNNAVGVPLTLLAAEAADEYVVCEIGTNAPGEVAALGRVACPDVAVVTSVGPSHVAGLGTLEQVAAEKASLLGCLPRDGPAVVWADSDPLAEAVAARRRPVTWFGASERADLRLTRYQPRRWAQRFEVNARLWVELPVPGRHNALNALAAMAAARHFGFEEAEAAAALADFTPVEMRLERVPAGAVTIVNDAYNANPSSVAAAAEVLAGCEASRRVAVLGDMLELGDRARELHLRTGREVAAAGIDLLIGVGALGRYIAMGAAEAGCETGVFDSVEEAGRRVPALLRGGDVVLIKGSRATAMERLIEPIQRAFSARRARPTGGDPPKGLER
jgi:UDP-N-acetylmuramoyl-tripeptide--D-alanyl-D-alanine ligase